MEIKKRIKIHGMLNVIAFLPLAFVLVTGRFFRLPVYSQDIASFAIGVYYCSWMRLWQHIRAAKKEGKPIDFYLPYYRKQSS